MRTWQVERRKRTRHLIELGGLVVKAGVVDLTGNDGSGGGPDRTAQHGYHGSQTSPYNQ